MVEHDTSFPGRFSEMIRENEENSRNGSRYRLYHPERSTEFTHDGEHFLSRGRFDYFNNVNWQDKHSNFQTKFDGSIKWHGYVREAWSVYPYDAWAVLMQKYIGYMLLLRFAEEDTDISTFVLCCPGLNFVVENVVDLHVVEQMINDCVKYFENIGCLQEVEDVKKLLRFNRPMPKSAAKRK